MIEGHLDPSFAALVDRFQKLFHKPADGGGALAVYVDGTKVVDVWSGYTDFEAMRWERDSVAMSFSTTKGVASTVAHRLVGDGVLTYDDPIAKWWPEFAAGGKEATTLRDVMTHRAGLHDLRSLIHVPEEILDHELMEERLAAATPKVHPDGRSGYHAVSYGFLIGGLVRRASGLTLPDQVQNLFAKPLGLEGLFVGLPLDQRHRVATLSSLPTGKASADSLGHRMEKRKTFRAFAEALLPLGAELMVDGHPRLMDAEMPSVNGFFDARSLAKMYGAIARGGEIDGVRILEQSTVDALSTKHVSTRDYVVGFPMGWRLGYHQGFTTGRPLPRAFGHFGFGGAGAWCDLDRRMSLAFVTNRMASVTTPFADARLARLGGIALKCHAQYATKTQG